jgi:hypothetical protein
MFESLHAFNLVAASSTYHQNVKFARVYQKHRWLAQIRK